MRTTSSLLLLSFAVFGAACGTTRFQVQRRVPAEVNVPAGKPMAVARIQGEQGDALVAELTEVLVGTKRFEILERRNLEAAIAELKFSSEGYVADETAISFGNMTGAAALVVGEVRSAAYNETLSSQADKCSREGALVDCTHHTRSAVANLAVQLSVIETESAKVLAAKSFEARRDRHARATDAEPPPLNAKDELLAECRAEIVQGFVGVVAPRDVMEWVVLREDDDLPELEIGNNYAQVGNWTKAVEQYRFAIAKAEAAAMEPELRAAAYYDLGLGLGYSGSFDEGIAEIERAFAIDPAALYRDQIQTLRRYKEEAARIAEQEGAKGRPGG